MSFGRSMNLPLLPPPFVLFLIVVDEDSLASIISSISSKEGIEIIGLNVSIEFELAAELKDDSIDAYDVPDDSDVGDEDTEEELEDASRKSRCSG